MRPSSVLLLAAVLVPGGATLAQNTRNVSQSNATAAAAAPRDDRKKAMTVADYARWRTIRDVAISDDGNWASYGYQQRRVDDTLFVKNLNDEIGRTSMFGDVGTFPNDALASGVIRPRTIGLTASFGF